MLPSPPAPLQDLQSFIWPMGPGWYNALKPEFEKPYFTELREFVAAERQQYPGMVFPRPEDVFSWAAGDPIDVEVVILGQDPYYRPGLAHGLSFSVLPGVPLPRSLDNIFKELESDLRLKELESDLRLKELESDPDVTFTRPGHGYLAGWARQGVLLLNTCLTVRSGEPNSHKNQGWEEFTDAVIRHISDNQQHVVFMLWGNDAVEKAAKKKKKAAIIDESRHDVLKSSHPSPLSARLGFFGCRHFS